MIQGIIAPSNIIKYYVLPDNNKLSAFTGLSLHSFKKEKIDNIPSNKLGSLGISAYFILGLMFFTFFSHEKTYAFDQKKWQEDKANRWRMGSDLIESKMLELKDSNEVLILLGQPDIRIDTQQQWIYQTGEGGGGVGFLLHYLNITYKEGKVIEATTTEAKG